MKGAYFVSSPGLAVPSTLIPGVIVARVIFETWRSWTAGDEKCPACGSSSIETEEVVKGDLRGERLVCQACNAVGGTSVF